MADTSAGGVNPFAWVLLAVAVVIDGFKMLLFLANALVVLAPLVLVGSFFVSVIEIVVVFGGLWMIGLYKPGKGQFFNTMATMGVSVLNLIPEVDDIPFTSPMVFFMITSTYAKRKAEQAVAPKAPSAPEPRPAPPPPPANEPEPEEAAA